VAGGSVAALLAVFSVFRPTGNGKSLDAMAGRFPTVIRNAPVGVIMPRSRQSGDVVWPQKPGSSALAEEPAKSGGGL